MPRFEEEIRDIDTDRKSVFSPTLSRRSKNTRRIESRLKSNSDIGEIE